MDYLSRVKVCSRHDLNERFSPHIIQRLLKNERVGFINLRRQGPKYKVYDLFDIPSQSQSRLFVVYLKNEKEVLVEYLARLIKKPLNKKSARAVSWRLKSLDDETRLKVIQMAGYDQLRRYDACVEEFLMSNLKSARVDFPGVKPQSLVSGLLESIVNKGLKGKIAVRKRKEKVFLVRLD